MRFAVALVLLLFVSACKPPPGSARVTIVFENETQTQCIKASAKTASGATVSATPEAIPRGGDTLVIGIGENSDLTGEISVTITRYPNASCTGAALGSETKSTQLVPGAPTAMLEFRYVGEAGLDAGPDDGGVDGGPDGGTCDLTSCGNAPGECEGATATGCAADGGCRFPPRALGTPCAGGVCNAGGRCAADVCAVLSAGASCDDGLACTPTATCQAGICRGECAMPPPCQRTASPLSCSATSSTSCQTVPDAEGTRCAQVAGGVCLQGACRPWLDLAPAPTNLRVNATTAPYPTADWALASPDGGACDTVISTTGALPTVTAGGCGSPLITATIDDAGVAVMSMTGLTIAPEARLHFIGARPAQLLVLGDADVRGVLSVAPTVAGQAPAGSNPPSCTTAQSGASPKAGGGGGGYGGVGGTGGENGGAGGAANATSSILLRGGCNGGNGAGNLAGGLGGGALQLIVNGTLTLRGVATASGGGGAAGTVDGEGGGGGGSGGTVILEARSIDLTGGAVTANGGGGGEGGDTGETSAPGAPGSFTSSTPTAAADDAASQAGVGGQGGANDQPGGTNGGNASASRGGGGGGGGTGAVFVRAPTCTRGTGIISGTQLMGFTCN